MTTYSANISVTGITYRASASASAQVVAPTTNPVHVPLDSTVILQVEADGINGYSTSALTGTFTEGSFVITNVTSPAANGVVLGCVLTGLGGGSIGSALPDGPIYIVTGVGTSTITFTSLSASGEGTIPAQTTASAVPFDVTDPFPYGHLTITVSPSSGVTVQDVNADGTTDASNQGDGAAIANFAGQGVGNVALTFAQTGTFDVTVEFVSSDANYVDTTASNLVTIIVP